jgi:hypothetical protein
VSLLLLPCALAVLWVLLRRANELCAVSVVDGRALLRRGRAPSGLVSELEDVVARAGVRRVTLRIVSESRVPRLVPDRRLPESVAQPLRNVIGRYQLTQFRHGRGPSS